jgi:hypothetical protein
MWNFLVLMDPWIQIFLSRGQRTSSEITKAKEAEGCGPSGKGITGYQAAADAQGFACRGVIVWWGLRNSFWTAAS